MRMGGSNSLFCNYSRDIRGRTNVMERKGLGSQKGTKRRVKMVDTNIKALIFQTEKKLKYIHFNITLIRRYRRK